MGQDKALLELAGKPLIEHAVTKLARICREVAILSNNTQLRRFAPVVKDLHPDCGPIGGIEAALEDARYDWSLIVPVDLPFTPTSFLRGWVEGTLRRAERFATRIALFEVHGIPQPTLLLVRRDAAPCIARAVEQGIYKLRPALELAAADLAGERSLHGDRSIGAPGNDTVGQLMSTFLWTAKSRFTCEESTPPGPAWWKSTPAQEAGTRFYFMNLNTPLDLVEAEKHVDLLDT